MSNISADNVSLPVDLSRLHSLSGGDAAFEREVLSVYIEDSEHFVREIDQLLLARNTPDAAAAAHSLKGASGNIGAAGLHGIAGEMEQVLSDGKDAEAVALYPELAQEFVKVRAYLSEHLSR